MDEPKGQPISMDKVALWLGWDQINMNLMKEQIEALSRELAKLKEGKE